MLQNYVKCGLRIFKNPIPFWVFRFFFFFFFFFNTVSVIASLYLLSSCSLAFWQLNFSFLANFDVVSSHLIFLRIFVNYRVFSKSLSTSIVLCIFWGAYIALWNRMLFLRCLLLLTPSLFHSSTYSILFILIFGKEELILPFLCPLAAFGKNLCFSP